MLAMYFKVTNEKECHHGYQYQTGLNVLDKPFEAKGSCVAGGLYFTDLENLDKFYFYGVWLRVVSVPEDGIMVKDPSGGKWRADRIILGDKYALYDVDTIEKFDLSVDENFIKHASMNGCVNFLEWWRSSGLELKYTVDAIDYASQNGHVNVLDWWLKAHNEFGLELKYTDAIDWASSKGHVDVLEWWLKVYNESGLELKYSCSCMDFASKNGHVDVLEWWLKVHKSYGLELKYTDDAMNLASENGYIGGLEWWLRVYKEFGLSLKYSSDAMDLASENGHVDVLEWWKNSGLNLKYSVWAMSNASMYGHVNVLEWWLKAHNEFGLELEYSRNFLIIAFDFLNYDVSVVSWWKSSGLPLK